MHIQDLWNGWLGKLWRKKHICKDHSLQKMKPIPFLTYKANDVKMFSRWSSVSQHCTFLSPLLSRALCCGSWRDKQLLPLLVLSWASTEAVGLFHRQSSRGSGNQVFFTELFRRKEPGINISTKFKKYSYFNPQFFV